MGKKKVIKYGSVYRDKDEGVKVCGLCETRTEAINTGLKDFPDYVGVCKVEYLENCEKNHWTVKGHFEQTITTNDGKKHEKGEKFSFTLEMENNPLKKEGVKNTGCLTDEAIRVYAETYYPTNVEACIKSFTKTNGIVRKFDAARSPQIF